MIGDLELDVMKQSYQLIRDLGDDEKKRVIQWLVGKFDLLNTNAFARTIHKMEDSTLGVSAEQVVVHRAPKQKEVEQEVVAPAKTKEKQVEVIATELTSYSIQGLFERVSTKTDVARVLLVAAYLQERDKSGVAELGSRQINKELKSIGRGIKNITQAINSLLKKEPKLLLMTRKTTSSQQGKKKYRVTELGMEKVREALVSGVLKV